MNDIGMTSHNDFHGRAYGNYEHRPEMPVDVDRERSPQLDLVVCRCRCGCACGSSRGDGDGDLDRGESANGGQRDTMASITASDPSAIRQESVDGDEGTRHQDIEVGDLGVFNYQHIRAALVKHAKCNCDNQEQDVYGMTSMTSSGYLPNGSMAVHHSGELSRVTSRAMSIASGSSQSGFTRSLNSSGLLAFAGGQFDSTNDVEHAYYFPDTPLPLSHDNTLAAAMGMSMHHGLHFINAETALEDRTAYDMW